MRQEIDVSSYEYDVLEWDVVDADTLRCKLDLTSALPEVWVDVGFDIELKLEAGQMVKWIDVRIDGIDTAETRGDEKRAGIPLSFYTRAYLLRKPPLRVRSTEWGQFARRCIGTVYLSDDREDTWANHLLSNGLTKPFYTEDGKRASYNPEEVEAIRQDVYHRLAHHLFSAIAYPDKRASDPRFHDNILLYGIHMGLVEGPAHVGDTSGFRLTELGEKARSERVVFDEAD